MLQSLPDDELKAPPGAFLFGDVGSNLLRVIPKESGGETLTGEDGGIWKWGEGGSPCMLAAKGVKIVE